LIVGTDEPVYTSLLPGFAYHRELLAMTDAGLPPVVVLKAATINGAKALGVSNKLGSIVVYNPQDLLRTAIGKIGPSGPKDHADWMLKLRSLRD